VRSYKTAVAHYPSTSVATQTATTKGRTSIASQRRTHLHCVTKERLLPTHLRCVTKRRTSIASKRTEPTHLCCVTTNDAPPLRHENTKRNDAPPLRHDEAYERTNETAFAPPLQRHEHEPQDRNERHEQRRRPLN